MFCHYLRHLRRAGHKAVLCPQITIQMATTTLHQSIARNYTARTSTPSFYASFINWCENQQHNRLLWIGLALAGHGCIFAPLSVLLVAMAGNSLILFMAVMASMGMALVVNLAAMPTKITIPVFLVSVLVDLGIIASCIALLLR